MSAISDETSMGGERGGFLTTHWSEIFSAGTTDEARREIVMDSLLRKYWKPVYCRIRHQGYDNEQAKDLTQGFFQDIVLNSNLIAQADRAKGRFRSFLLTALKHYLISVKRKETAQKRRPSGRMLVLEANDLPELPKARSTMGPDQIFHYVWATEIIDEVIAQVERECRGAGKEKHWQIFHAKILAPIMENQPSPMLRELCEEYGVANEAQASNMIITVKRCFRKALEDQLRRFVRTEADIEGELNELLGILAQGGAG